MLDPVVVWLLTSILTRIDTGRISSAKWIHPRTKCWGWDKSSYSGSNAASIPISRRSDSCPRKINIYCFKKSMLCVLIIYIYICALALIVNILYLKSSTNVPHRIIYLIVYIWQIVMPSFNIDMFLASFPSAFGMFPLSWDLWPGIQSLFCFQLVLAHFSLFTSIFYYYIHYYY